MARRPRLGRWWVMAIGAAALLLTGELITRTYYFVLHQYDPFYLVVPFRSAERHQPSLVTPYQPEMSYRKGGTIVVKDHCFDRSVKVTLNSQGWRGREWSLQKPPGTFRIVILGASSTFGVDNPDEATWPMFLEESLRRRYGPNIEVLSASWPGVRIAYLLGTFSNEFKRYRPDMVIFYEGWNDTPLEPASEADSNIANLHFHTWWGSWLSRLYYRSMLYTYLVEKCHFVLARHYQDGLIPRVGYYEKQVGRLIQSIRQGGAIPVMVLQVNDSHFKPLVRDLKLNNLRGLRAFVLQAAQVDGRTNGDLHTQYRFYETQLLVEVVRRTAESKGIRVIDPWPTFQHYDKAAPLFCGPVHLTDLGNRLLAETVNEHLDLGRPASFHLARVDPKETGHDEK